MQIHLEAVFMLNPEMHMEGVIEPVWRFAWKPRLGVQKMYIQAVTKRLSRGTWML
jgi:hypothetical protein